MCYVTHMMSHWVLPTAPGQTQPSLHPHPCSHQLHFLDASPPFCPIFQHPDLSRDHCGHCDFPADSPDALHRNTTQKMPFPHL